MRYPYPLHRIEIAATRFSGGGEMRRRREMKGKAVCLSGREPQRWDEKKEKKKRREKRKRMRIRISPLLSYSRKAHHHSPRERTPPILAQKSCPKIEHNVKRKKRRKGFPEMCMLATMLGFAAPLYQRTAKHAVQESHSGSSLYKNI